MPVLSPLLKPYRSLTPPVGKTDLSSQIGVINFLFQDPRTLRGLFTIPSLYGGHLALEVASKIKGEDGEFAGEYKVITYEGLIEDPEEIFATGELILKSIGEQGVFEASWFLEPVPAVLPLLGYVSGTALQYFAVGLETTTNVQLVVGWSNGTYTRVWSTDDRSQGLMEEQDTFREFGIRAVAVEDD